MTDQALIDDIEWLYGGHDQGQHDDVRFGRVIHAIHEDDKQTVRILTTIAKTLLEPPHTIEDVAKFIRFLDYYLGYSL